MIGVLSELFAVFGLPNYLHRESGVGFISGEIKSFLLERGIALSHSTPYNPMGSGQCEKIVGIIWKNLTLAQHSNHLQSHAWESVLQTALHSLRSPRCTSTGEKPHMKGSSTLLGRRHQARLFPPGCSLTLHSFANASHEKMSILSKRWN